MFLLTNGLRIKMYVLCSPKMCSLRAAHVCLSLLGSLIIVSWTPRAFQEWSGRFEKAISSCMANATAQADHSFFGRGKMTCPKLRRNQYAVAKHRRPGEVQQTCGFLNRAVARWFKQLLRLQSYMHAVKSVNAESIFCPALPCGIANSMPQVLTTVLKVGGHTEQ